jgi:hypothetical protein
MEDETRHRTVAIADTRETIPGFPETLKIYLIPASKYWQVRARVGGVKVKKSLKTESRTVAIRAAKEFYNELLMKKAQNLPLIESGNFIKVAESLFKEDQGRVDRKERRQSVVDDAKSIYEAALAPFFKNIHCKDVTYQKISDYVTHLRARPDRKMVGSKTINNHFIILRKLLGHAVKLGYIEQVPIFPTVIQQDNPRDWFAEEQYILLLAIVDREIAKGIAVRGVPLTIHLRHLIEFTVNSFLRPPDLKTLKHNQIAVVKNDDGAYLRIMAFSKVKPAPVVTMPAAAEVYAQLSGNEPEPESYVFFPEYSNRDYAMQTMNRQFNHVLKLAKLKDSPNGTKRVLYSLRHTCIMNTLLRSKNINLLTLARNARTSVDMLERFYASQLTAEMNIDQLHDVKTSAEDKALALFNRAATAELTANPADPVDDEDESPYE